MYKVCEVNFFATMLLQYCIVKYFQFYSTMFQYLRYIFSQISPFFHNISQILLHLSCVPWCGNNITASHGLLHCVPGRRISEKTYVVWFKAITGCPHIGGSNCTAMTSCQGGGISLHLPFSLLYYYNFPTHGFLHTYGVSILKIYLWGK